MKVTFGTDREYRIETGRWYGAFIRAYVDVPADLEVWPESHWPGFALRQADVSQSYTAL